MSSVPDRVAARLEDLSEGPTRTRMQLGQQGPQSLRTTVMRTAWTDQGIDLDDPPTVDQWYLPEEGLVVIDLDSAGGDVDGRRDC